MGNKHIFTKKNIIKPSHFVDLVFILFFLGFIILKCIYFQFTTRLNTGDLIAPQNIYMIVSTLGVLLVIFSISFFIFGKRQKTGLLVLNILLSLVLLSDTIYFRYYYNAITVPVLYQIRLIGSVGGSVKTLLKNSDIIFLIDLPVMLAAIILIKKLTRLEAYKINLKQRTVVSVVILALGIATFQTSYYNTDTSAFAYDNNYVIKNLGSFYFHYYDAKRFAKEKFLQEQKLTTDEKELINNFFASKTVDGNKYNGIASGKNLIIVQVEALQNFIINRKLNGKEITPNLNNYINESIYFDNFHYQIGGGNTSDAEFLCNTSLYPLKEGAVYFRFPSNKYYTLPMLLKNSGYKSYVSHANNPSFWNRTEAYKAIGFDTYINNKVYTLDEIVGWGLSDPSMFRQTLEMIDADKPFYWFPITLSTHHPFNFFDEYEGFDAGEFDGTFLGDFLKAAHYADKALGDLIRELKDNGLYENSILVMYGDHSAMQKDYVEQLEKFLGKEINNYEWASLQEVPCFIHFPGLEEAGTNSTEGGQIDLFPTVANLMGYETPYTMGKDLLNTERGYAVLRNGTVITDEYYFINSTQQAYDREGNPTDSSKYMDEIKSLQKQLYISDIIVKKNAFKKMGFEFN